jgi:hypothetical protein
MPSENDEALWREDLRATASVCRQALEPPWPPSGGTAAAAPALRSSSANLAKRPVREPTSRPPT